MPTEIDYARLAAYIDGEGHIGICTKKNRKAPYAFSLSIGNTDKRLMEWLSGTFGGLPIRDKSTIRKKKYWLWFIGGEAAATLLENCLPYFIMKRDQAEIAIEFHALMRKQIAERKASTRKYGKSFLTEEMIGKRQDLAERLHLVRSNASERIAS